jgi:TolA-binding protein
LAMTMTYLGSAVLLALVAPAAAYAQDTSPTQIAKTAAGRVGERQDQQVRATGIAPTERLATRLDTRVRSRIATRVDRFYRAESDATSTIREAQDRSRRSR